MARDRSENKSEDKTHSFRSSSVSNDEWRRIVSRFEKPLWSYFSKRVDNNSDIDDLVQEVFLRLVKRNEKQIIDRLEPYLFRTAASVLTDFYRRRKVRHADVHQNLDQADDDRSAFGSDLTPERVLLGKDELKQLISALEDLPQRTHDIFVLSAFEFCRSAEIAKMLGISVRAVEKHLAKAMKHISRKRNQ